MAKKQLFVIADLGGGDGGKGGVVHKICEIKKAHTVIKVGGAQGSHGVRTSSGLSFNFSHFGCGTLEGISTYVSKKMVIDPVGLICEGDLLKYNCGVRNAFEMIIVDEEALCVTPFHRIASQLRELARKDNPKGTIGTGVGEAVYDAEIVPNLAIRVKDIKRADLRDMLEAIRLQKIRDLAALADIDNFWDADRDDANYLVAALKREAMSGAAAHGFKEMISRVRIADTSYLEKEIFSRDGAAVIETSHGILTDRYYGFHPHTTKLRTISNVSFGLAEDCDYDGEVLLIGVTRAYQIRHGAGPMVTENPEIGEALLPGSHKEENRWQGKVRVGPLDLVALRYAINVCGGVSMFSGLAVTWFDQIPVFGSWQYCDSYEGADNLEFFTPRGEIIVRRGWGDIQLARQERLGTLLNACRPNISGCDIPPTTSRKDLTVLCTRVLKEKLGVPVRMISFGPTEKDKVCI